ncbi:hypothetical protein [Streptosporangium sp. V21-05]|uniref:hypothetical protein n=1 Tax=Streptosporangium sp. V21-05 TaxID=3446115 RepID=UPI003F52C976
MPTIEATKSRWAVLRTSSLAQEARKTVPIRQRTPISRYCIEPSGRRPPEFAGIGSGRWRVLAVENAIRRTAAISRTSGHPAYHPANEQVDVNGPEQARVRTGLRVVAQHVNMVLGNPVAVFRDIRAGSFRCSVRRNYGGSLRLALSRRMCEANAQAPRPDAAGKRGGCPIAGRKSRESACFINQNARKLSVRR